MPRRSAKHNNTGGCPGPPPPGNTIADIRNTSPTALSARSRGETAPPTCFTRRRRVMKSTCLEYARLTKWNGAAESFAGTRTGIYKGSRFSSRLFFIGIAGVLLTCLSSAELIPGKETRIRLFISTVQWSTPTHHVAKLLAIQIRQAPLDPRRQWSESKHLHLMRRLYTSCRYCLYLYV